MDERLKLAESYYAVARDLQAQGQRMLDTADMLGATADRICEARMREKQPEKCECGCLKPAPTYPCGACGRVAVSATGDGK